MVAFDFLLVFYSDLRSRWYRCRVVSILTVVQWIGCRACNEGLAMRRSLACFPIGAWLRNNSGQVLHTIMPLSPSSIVWHYLLVDHDALWLGGYPLVWHCTDKKKKKCYEMPTSRHPKQRNELET